MTEAEVIRVVREHLEGQFPKSCTVCKRSYGSFREFLLITKPVGSTMSHDAELNDWNPVVPLEYLRCKSTALVGTPLCLSSSGMPVLRLWPLMNWARAETQKRGQTLEELLNYLRDEIRKQVVGEPNPGSA